MAGSRIGLDIVTYAFRRGRTAEDIFRSYPSIGSLAKVYGAIAFILEHPQEIEAYLREVERAYAEFKATHPLAPEMLEPFERARDEKHRKIDLKIAFQADANLDPEIWRGLLRREPSMDFQGHVGVIPDATPDPEVLWLAARAGRVLVSADVKTMPVHFAEFVAQWESPGMILIPSSRSVGSVIEGLLLLWLSWTPDRLRNPAVWLPATFENN